MAFEVRPTGLVMVLSLRSCLGILLTSHGFPLSSPGNIIFQPALGDILASPLPSRGWDTGLSGSPGKPRTLDRGKMTGF